MAGSLRVTHGVAALRAAPDETREQAGRDHIMTKGLRWLFVALLAGHGIIHLLGAAKGFGAADVAQLTQPIGVGQGVLWLLAAAVTLASAALLASGAPTWWWLIALCGAALSQVTIATSWSDAKAGTIVNAIVVLVAGYAFASSGPFSFHAQYLDQAARALAAVDPRPTRVTEADLEALPQSLAAYVRASGAVGSPRVVSFHADFHGRIRSGPDAAWMSFTGQQVNTYGASPKRIFVMDASRSGLPVTVLHEYVGTTATMRVRLLSLLPIVNAAGPEMDRSETVTVFNDLVVLAPGAIIDAPVTWTSIDPLHLHGEFTHGGQRVSAILTFNAQHDLVDFASDDRMRASTDGKAFTPTRWSTPLSGHHDTFGHRTLTSAEGVWGGPQPAALFTYLEFHLDNISFNCSGAIRKRAESAPPLLAVGR